MYTTNLRLAADAESLATSTLGSSSSWTTFEEARSAAEGQFRLSITSNSPDMAFCQVSLAANGEEMFSGVYEVLDPSATRTLGKDLDKVAKEAPKDMEFFRVSCYRLVELFDTADKAQKRAGELVADAYVDVVMRKVPVTIPSKEATGKKALDAAKRILNIDGSGEDPEQAFTDEADTNTENEDVTPKTMGPEDNPEVAGPIQSESAENPFD